MVVVYRQDNDGCGDTWCQVWATDGNYSLEIVDEAPPTSVSFDDVLRPSATVVFGRGEASIDDDAERVLDSIANWLEAHPDVPAEIRGHRGPLEVPAPPRGARQSRPRRSRGAWHFGRTFPGFRKRSFGRGVRGHGRSRRVLSSRSSSYGRWSVVLFGIALAVVSLTFTDYGVTWDEASHVRVRGRRLRVLRVPSCAKTRPF